MSSKFIVIVSDFSGLVISLLKKIHCLLSRSLGLKQRFSNDLTGNEICVDIY